MTLEVFTAGRLSPYDPIALALGAAPLAAEESENITAGIAFQRNGLTASVDLYQIDITGRFGQSAAFTVPANIPNSMRFARVNFFTIDSTPARAASMPSSPIVAISAPAG